MQEILTQFFLQPMLNVLLLLYTVLFDNFGLAIIAFTVLVRVAILPLTLQQLNQAKKMSSLQPEMVKIREKYKNDQQKQSQETMALYREAGVNPIGCLGPMVIQFPIWIGLYSAIAAVMPANASRLVPEGILALSSLVYPIFPFAVAFATVPLNREFLWLDLSSPDPFFLMAILVGGTMWMQQKMATNPNLQVDPSQAQMTRTMLTVMPLMFGFFTLSVSSGLAVYWLVSNLISIILQYFVTGWGSLEGFNPVKEIQGIFRPRQTATAAAAGKVASGGPKKGTANSSSKATNGARPASANARTNGTSRAPAKAGAGNGTKSNPAAANGAAANGTSDDQASPDADDTGESGEVIEGEAVTLDDDHEAARSARSRRRSANARSRSKRKDG